MDRTIKIATNIRDQYTEKPKTKLDELIELNKKAKRPAEIFAYGFGTVGTLVLGAGMCLAMEVLGTGLMPIGIAIGLVGITMVAINYTLYKGLEKKGKAKYAKKILSLSNEILHE
ncbi:MAG: dihydropteridine reductase [Clostridia bacterium]|nr:dihydropteridine reductase [Clostridia bacterium]